jgi:rhamnogalacturonan endolyase
MEFLNRGVVVIRTSSTAAYVGWRMLGTDPTDVAFNLYRAADGGAPVKLNVAPITTTTNFSDSAATGLNLSVANSYFVVPVIGGVEQAPSEAFTLPAAAPTQSYLRVPLQRPAGGTVSLPLGTQTPPSGTLNYTYSPNDASVGDVDGDGQYEIILKWDPSNSQDNSNEGLTGNTIVDAYRLDGTRLWRIDLGRNIRSGAHYSQFLVYDFDGDGRAEVVMRTADGSVDGVGTVIGDPAADYRDGYTGTGDGRWGRVLGGPEWLTVFNGLTGAIIGSIPFEPARGSVSSWGDSYGNRVDRFQATVAYLDGVHPSIIWGRGYAGPQSGFNARNEVAAYDYANGQLSVRWIFEAATNGANAGYVGQTAHSITVGDVDNDGKDEITTGAAALDDDGTLLYNTGLGHGDALHLSDMLPSRPGLEVFMPHESPGSYGNSGGEYRDARTGALIFGIPADNDVGRGVAFDIDPNYPGYEMWAATDDPNGNPRMVYNSQGQPLYRQDAGTPTTGNDDIPANFGVWWDSDLLRELLDGTTISNWQYGAATPFRQTFFSASGSSSNNGTKSTPSLSGDILGDWREEVIFRSSTNTELRIYTTTTLATNRIYTLMHDPQYREAIAWQNSGYNQPPHPSFFVGNGMAAPPVPQIYTVQFVPELAGDYNDDNLVDLDDYTVWRDTLGSSEDLRADGDHSGTVDDADYDVWKGNFGAVGGGSGGGGGAGASSWGFQNGTSLSEPLEATDVPPGDAGAISLLGASPTRITSPRLSAFRPNPAASHRAVDLLFALLDGAPRTTRTGSRAVDRPAGDEGPVEASGTLSSRDSVFAGPPALRLGF